MAGSRITYVIDDAALRAMLERQAQAPTGNARLAPRLGEYLRDSTRARFTSQAAPDGTPWAPLKQSTIRRKKSNADKILTLRGYLRGQISWQSLDDNSVEVGTSVKYGAIHQFGGEIQQPARQATVRYRSVAGRVLFAGAKHKLATERQVSIPAHAVNMPARPFLGISAEDDAQIKARIREWLEERYGR